MLDKYSGLELGPEEPFRKKRRRKIQLKKMPSLFLTFLFLKRKKFLLTLQLLSHGIEF